MSHPIAEALARRRARRARDGIPVRRWRTAWRTACQAAGVPTRFLHDCRRTAARNLIRASVPERVAPDRAQEPRHLRPRQHHQRTGTPQGRGSAGRLSGAAPQATPRGRAHPASPRPAPARRRRPRGRRVAEAGGVIRLSPARSKTLVGRILPISQPIAEALARRRARRDHTSPLVFHATPPHKAAHAPALTRDRPVRSSTRWGGPRRAGSVADGAATAT